MLLGLGTQSIAAQSEDEVLGEQPGTVRVTQITITGEQGDVKQRMIRFEIPAGATEVAVRPFDLLREDNRQVLPGANIQVGELPAQVDTTGILVVSLEVSLAGVPSGAYTGELLVTSTQGAIAVPLVVEVKDSWLVPLLVLVFGIVVGTAVSSYRAQGFRRDQVLVQIDRVRRQVRDAEPAPAASFQQRIDAALIDAEVALQAARWEQAQQAVERAEDFWVAWRRNETGWQSWFESAQQIEKRLDDLVDMQAYAATVQRQLEQAQQQAPNEAGPQALQETLDLLTVQTNHGLDLQLRFHRLKEHVNKLPDPHYDTGRAKEHEVEQQLRSLQPADLQTGKDRTIADQIEQAVREIQQVTDVSEKNESGMFAFDQPGAGTMSRSATLSNLLAPPPFVANDSPENQKKWAQLAAWRLRMFPVLVYLITVPLLAATGYNELYLNEPLFGANGLTDYFGLLAWGFGSEATRVAVVDLVRGWNQPTTAS